MLFQSGIRLFIKICNSLTLYAKMTCAAAFSHAFVLIRQAVIPRTSASLCRNVAACRFKSSNAAIPENSQLPEVVDYDRVKSLVDSKANNLVDVREPNELVQEGAIPTAVNIPLGQIPAAFSLDVAELRDEYNLTGLRTKKDDVVFFCRAGVRAMNAARTAQQLGYVNAKSYKGSIQDWNSRSNHSNSNKQ